MNNREAFQLAALAVLAIAASAHEGHGKKNAPESARRLKSPLSAAQAKPELGKPVYERTCAACHDADGQAKSPAASAMKPRPINIVDHRMDSMADGEVYWVVTNGIGTSMPGFKTQLSDIERWQVVLYVRHLRKSQSLTEHH